MSANDNLPLAIDRRPVRMINCFNGDPADDAKLGRATWWADDRTSVTDLETRLSGSYLVGYRRFMLILPAGYPKGQHLMPSSQWLTMPKQRRARLMSVLPRWKQTTRDPSVELYVYAGFALSDPASLDMPEPAVTPDITRDWAWFQANWRQWIEDCRIDGIGFDTASKPEHRAALVRVARVLSIAGIKCIGEAIPTVAKGGGLTPAKEITQAPWFALDQFIANRDRRRAWRFDPKTTECGVGFRESMLVPGRERRITTERDVREFVSRGLIPYVYASKWDDVVMELTG